MNAHVGAPARRSALLLHAMSGPDREWILARLPEDQRATLRELLGELSSLGIPADRKLLEAISAPGGTAGAVGPQPAASDLGGQRVDMLRGADPRRISVILHNEPAGLIAAVLRAAEWPWRDSVLQQLEPLKRKQVLEMLAPQLGAAAGSAALGVAIRSIAERLGPSGTDGGAPGVARAAPPALLQGLFGQGARLLGAFGGRDSRRVRR